ncbi:MAG: hypothetical protein V2A34_06385, partial [Lentisphaerota bacterium]
RPSPQTRGIKKFPPPLGGEDAKTKTMIPRINKKVSNGSQDVTVVSRRVTFLKTGGIQRDRWVFRALAGLVLCWGLAFSMACRLTDHYAEETAGDETVVGRFLGASRVALSQRLYLEADNFFHSGVSHVSAAAFSDIFQKTKAVISPQQHKHTEGGGIYELMPWLEFATTMDPHNVEVYLTAAFWLAQEGERPDLAEKILYDGQRNNPGDYRILQEKASLYMQEKKDDYAARALDMGLKLWPSGMDKADEQTMLDLGRMLTLRAFLYEFSGDRENALKLSRKALSIFPGNLPLKQRVSALEKGEINSEKVRDMWDAIFARKTMCSREEAEHEHDHEHEHEHESIRDR